MSSNLVERIAGNMGLSKDNLINTVKQTVFKKATDAQLMVFFGMCDELKFNPFTKMIWAYPDKDGGVQTMISYSGWIQLANQHPQFDGEETTFVIDPQTEKPISATCYVWRKDRSHPTIATVYFKEWYKGSNPNWVDRPIHMLGIRAYVQAVRKAFGLHQYDYEGEYVESQIIKDVTPLQEATDSLTQLVENIESESAPQSVPQEKVNPEPLVSDELPPMEEKKPAKTKKVITDDEAEQAKQVAESINKLYRICQDMFEERKDNPEIPEGHKSALIDLLENGKMGKYNSVEELTKVKIFLEKYQPFKPVAPEEDPEVAAMAALWSK